MKNLLKRILHPIMDIIYAIMLVYRLDIPSGITNSFPKHIENKINAKDLMERFKDFTTYLTQPNFLTIFLNLTKTYNYEKVCF